MSLEEREAVSFSSGSSSCFASAAMRAVSARRGRHVTEGAPAVLG
jgi:hypothetical protein